MTRAQDKAVQLILSHWVPPSHPLQAAIEDWANDIKKNSNDTIDLVIFPAELLGKAFAHYDMARNGDVSFALVSPGYHPESFPIIAAGDVPFVYDDAKIGTAAIDEWYRKYAARELAGGALLFQLFVQDPGTLHSQKKVVVPDDIEGLKFANRTLLWRTIKQLGGEGLGRSARNSRDALERGEADGISSPGDRPCFLASIKLCTTTWTAEMYG